jgi:hypothetical protein
MAPDLRKRDSGAVSCMAQGRVLRANA